MICPVYSVAQSEVKGLAKQKGSLETGVTNPLENPSMTVQTNSEL